MESYVERWKREQDEKSQKARKPRKKLCLDKQDKPQKEVSYETDEV